MDNTINFVVAGYEHEYFLYCVVRQEMDKKHQVENEVVVAIHTKMTEAYMTKMAMERTLVMNTEVT